MVMTGAAKHLLFCNEHADFYFCSVFPVKMSVSLISLVHLFSLCYTEYLLHSYTCWALWAPQKQNETKIQTQRPTFMQSRQESGQNRVFPDIPVPGTLSAWFLSREPTFVHLGGSDLCCPLQTHSMNSPHSKLPSHQGPHTPSDFDPIFGNHRLSRCVPGFALAYPLPTVK